MIIGISGKLQSGKDTVGHIIQYIKDYKLNKYTHPITVDDFQSYMDNEHHLKSRWKIKKFAGYTKQIASILSGKDIELFEDDAFKNTEMDNSWWYWVNIKTSKRIPYLGNENLGLVNTKFNLIRYTYRQFLQEIGTDAMRDIIHPDIWINALMASYIPANEWDLLTDTSSLVYPNWIVTDVRFENELHAILNKGGVVIRVESPEYYYLNSATNSIVKYRTEVNEPNHFPFGTDNELVRMSKYFHPSEMGLDSYENFPYIIRNDGDLMTLIHSVNDILTSMEYK